MDSGGGGSALLGAGYGGAKRRRCGRGKRVPTSFSRPLYTRHGMLGRAHAGGVAGESTVRRVARSDMCTCLDTAHGQITGRRPCGRASPPRRMRGICTPESHAGATWMGGMAGTRARATCLARRRRRAHQVLFHGCTFENAKLTKVATKLTISKNKSCRGAIDLQLSQRATYVLINGFVGKTC
jgi:hypothetical protein